MNVAILMMQKNEEELLKKWVSYHSYLVGHKNLYIYDNGSNSEVTIEELDSLEKLGVNIIRDKNTKQDYENRGNIFCEKIKELDDNAQYDFYMPIDCDEFLAVLDKDGNISCDSMAFKYSLSKYKKNQELLMIDAQFYNSSVSPMWFNKQPYRKCFFKRDSISSLDQGFHWGKVTTSSKEQRTNIIHFHFHNKPFEIAKSHAEEKLQGRVENFNIETLRNYKGAGFHLVRFFLETEEKYIRNQTSLKHIKSKSLLNKMTELGITWPFIKDIEKSRENLMLSSEDDGFKNILPKFRGSIDDVILEDNTIRIKGWGIVNYSREVRYIFLEFENKTRIPFVINERTMREDVNEMLNVKGNKLGFTAHFDRSLLSQVDKNVKKSNIVAFTESNQSFHSFDMFSHKRNIDYFAENT